jgi:hypothetical protein
MDEGYEASVKMLQAETTESHTLSMELMRVLKKTEQERDGLRRSYLLECLSESLWETPSTDVGDTIIGGIKKLGGTIDAIEFVKLLGKAPEDARVRVVVGCAPFVDLWYDEQAIRICALLPLSGREKTLEMLRNSKLRVSR